MPVDLSEADFEKSIVDTLTGGRDASEPTVEYDAGQFMPGGYQQRDPDDYNGERCLIPQDLYEFVVSTQPKEWRRLKEQFGQDTKSRFVQRVSQEIEKRGTLNVLRRGVSLFGCRFDLVYFRPSTSRNPDLQKKYRVNVFSVRPAVSVQHVHRPHD